MGSMIFILKELCFNLKIILRFDVALKINFDRIRIN